MSGVIMIGDPAAANSAVQKCFHNRILNSVPWRISKKPKENNPAYFLSEYQEEFKRWPFQPPRPPLKPGLTRQEANAVTDMKTLYRKDFAAPPVHGNKARRGTTRKKEDYVIPTPVPREKTTYKHDYTEQKFTPTSSFRPNAVYTPPVVRFKGNSEYRVAFEAYDKEVAKACRPALVKPPENIEISKATCNKNVSTCQDDYKAHSDVERAKPITMKENNIQPEGPFEGDTMYKNNYVKKTTPSSPTKFKVKKAPKREDQAPFAAVTTFMADYKHHKNVKRQASCRPPEVSLNLADIPFSGETTVSATYKAWPVSPKETPAWRKKCEYKPSPGPHILKSTYMMDYKKPTTYNPPATPKIPGGAGENVLKHTPVDSQGDATSTYKGSYSAWENVRPAAPFKVKRNYESPKEKMHFESTMRSHYRGEYTKRADLCRHVSEHRRLNCDKSMSFRTTYQDTYTSASAQNVIRPKSSPPALKSATASTQLPAGQSADKPASCLNVSRDSGIDTGPSSPVANS